ncbi:phage portal protein [Microvirga tunisiensis]|jgi:HK97 family phage portal protein|uniref:Phage portal protein n=1 Tax=Microvirga tunisiensis TaxID=2108360 RepID=A0A5N7MGW6_9HYPH|nr:phage portal protein [Microvirga tunisiensis]MPR07943.1 phage portal protein [Microvirga tunisiensis]MPR26255.1 phage portal protein [Microvirga tunisiensis]
MFNRLTRWLQAPPEAKASRVQSAIALYVAGRAVWTPRDYAALSREGFQKNAIVHRAVRLVSEAAAALPLVLKSEGREIAAHPLLALLSRPNAREGGQRFLESLYGHLMVSGNAYVEAVSLDGAPQELYALRPDRMRVVPDADGWPAAYEYAVGTQNVRFAIREDEALAPILHLTLFHPVDDHYGLSPMEAAATALDIHNAAGAWNKALLDNAARPSGALVVGGATLTDAQFDRLKGELEANYQGAGNAGRPLLLEGGIDWRPLSLSPKDMDFVEAKAAAAREIALAFGVPPLLLGLPGDSTHANYAEANRAFYRQTVIPLVKRTAESLSHWLAPAFGETLRLEPDLDAIEALADERESLWRRVTAAAFLSDDEKREAVGYGRAAAGKGRA